jgi:hypothetical protein
LVGIYNSSFGLEQTITITGMGTTYGLSCLTDPTILVVCDSTNRSAWMCHTVGGWEKVVTFVEAGTTQPSMLGTIINIVSNYEDLGIANEKRVPRAYLDVDSQYGTAGAFTIESDYDNNVTVHVDDETTEPSGATQLRPFAHPGHQTWKYTNSQFDSEVEQWKQCRIDVESKGTAFRYNIKIGDMANANHGTLRIRPPKMLTQVKGYK